MIRSRKTLLRLIDNGDWVLLWEALEMTEKQLFMRLCKLDPSLLSHAETLPWEVISETADLALERFAIKWERANKKTAIEVSFTAEALAIWRKLPPRKRSRELCRSIVERGEL